MTHEEVHEQITEVLVDALGVDEDEVTPQAKLVEDLGAESIDFLDIAFRLEKTFGIKIDTKELFPDNVLQNPQYVKEGQVTEEGIAELKKHLPHADLSDFEKDPQVEAFSNVFTVEAVAKFVEAKLEAKGE